MKKTSFSGKRMAVVGLGNMGSALVSGILEQGLVKRRQLTGADPDARARARMTRKHGIICEADACRAVKGSGVVLLAVKPQAFPSLAEKLVPQLASGQLVISVMAGIPALLIKKRLGGMVRVVRTMPNTPSLLGQGMTAVSRGPGAKAADLKTALAIFGTLGETLEVAERQMDLVTGLSGSGPAYFFLMVEALIEAGTKQGLSKDKAGRLAVQTALGAARMLVESGESAASLRQKVTSKGGTTEAALKVFSGGGFKKLVDKAVRAAARRGKELAKGIK